jgi:hypothetical protein
MQRLNVRVDWHRAAIPLIIVAACALALGLGTAMARFGFGVREIAILVLVLVGLILILSPSDRVLRVGFYAWLLSFGLGWRTLYVTPSLNIHPSEVLAWILFLLMVAQSILYKTRLDWKIPIAIPVLIALSLLGIATGLFRSTPIDIVLNEAKVFLVLVPSYYCIKWFVRSREEWEQSMLIAIGVVVYISCIGMIDYFFPGLSLALAGRESGPTVAVDEFQRFTRVGFTFYGSFTAGYVIFMFVGVTMCRMFGAWRKSHAAFLFYVVALGLELGAMYLSGYRGIWYSFCVFMVAYVFLQRGAWVIAAGLVPLVSLLPQEFYRRFISLFDPQYADSSQFSRIDRASEALKLAKASPILGNGWGSSGYVHSDLTQIAANIGFPALATFLLWMLAMVVRLLRLWQGNSWAKPYAAALIATICGLVVLLGSEGLIAFVQLVIPLWFLFAMIDKLTLELAPTIKNDLTDSGEFAR